jgi:SAM-dependent methyltransferase
LYCRGETFEPLFTGVVDRLGYVPGQWAFWRCRGCGSAVLAPFPKPSELASFYPPIYSFAIDQGPQSRFRRGLARLEYRWFYQWQYEAQARQVLGVTHNSDRPGRRLLDVGCGRGMRLLAFQRHGFTVHGMDFQAEAVAYVQDSLGIPAVCTDVENLSHCFPPESFDVITSFYVLEHVPDVTALVTCCRNLLRPGGWMVLAVPYIDSVQAGWLRGRWSTVTEAPRHLSIPSRQAMKHLCHRAGFDPVLLRPDSIFMCAGVLGLSLVPGSATTHVYGGGRLRALASRFLGAGVTALALPWCWLENHLFRQPAIGMVFARKPDSPASPPGGPLS